MKNNCSHLAILTINDFLKNLNRINYSKLTGRSYHCVKGVLRWYLLLESVHIKLCKKPLKEKKLAHTILLVGIYQVLFLNIKKNIVINELLASARKLGLNNLCGFFNSTIRQVQPLNIKDVELNNYISRQIKKDWPQFFDYISTINFSSPPICLNLINPSEFHIKNKNHKLFKAFKFIGDNCVVLPDDIKLNSVLGLEQGDFYIQNISAQYIKDIIKLLPLGANIEVLDACCGVGGKAIAANQVLRSNASITALDNNSTQIKIFKENIKKYNIEIKEVICDDLNKFSGQKFDLIMLDAPCSASGNIRKYPELHFRTNKEELEKLNKLQAELINSAFKLLRPGGFLIYMTCSIFKSENDLTIAKFLASNDKAQCHFLDDFPNRSEFGYQILGTESKLGYFYSIINNLA